MLKSIDGPTEAAGASDGEFKNCLAVKYILFAAFGCHSERRGFKRTAAAE